MSTPAKKSPPLWTPAPERTRAAAITAFGAFASERSGRDLSTYDALHAWSIEDLSRFWRTYAEFAGIAWHQPPTTYLADASMPGAQWCPAGSLNYAEALLYPRDREGPIDVGARIALIGATETGSRRTLTWKDLRELVGRIRASLVAEGVQRGDRVVAYACNLPETTALFLACASLGAIFSSCSPDFGAEAASARFAQVEPTLLFGSTAYHYGGRRFDTREALAMLRGKLPTVRRTIVLPYPGEETPALEGGVAWDTWLAEAPELTFASLPFEHPLYVLFSSGTTGLPKAMVHRAGGALLKHHNEQRLHCDLGPGDVAFYFTTCGWMMWNWLVSVLAQGTTAVLYEGHPGHPDLEVLWDLADDVDISFFGTSARYLHALDTEGIRPRETHRLGSLRTIASTGSPLSPAGFEYVYRDIKKDVHLASIAGGTDIVGCFMLGVPTLPVHAGEIQRPALGVDLAAFDPEGNAVRGEPGELVCRQPLPSMPLRFWNDPDGGRYRDAYFDTYPGVWRHGDLIEITERGGIVVYGRSDATLNPGGVRIGTAEIYRPLEPIDEIVEAAAVGKKDDGDEAIWLCVVLREGVELDEALRERVRRAIRSGASPRHVPKRIFAVPQIPRTRSGKAMEIAVGHLVNGREVPNLQVMANPEAVEQIAAVLRAEGVVGPRPG